MPIGVACHAHLVPMLPCSPFAYSCDFVPRACRYFETTALHTLFSSLYTLGVTSVGTWGTIEQNMFAGEWDFAMRQYILGNYTVSLTG